MSKTTDTTPRTFYTLAAWQRIGSDDHEADTRTGASPISREDLDGALAAHHEADLAACADDAARAAAIAQLVQGYLHGG